MPLDIQDLMVTKLGEYSPELYDNVLKSNFLLYKLRNNKKVKKLPGGAQIEEYLMYPENDRFLTTATYDWKQANANVTISGLEARQNADSETRKYNLLESRIRVCEITMQNTIAKAMFSTRNMVADSGNEMIEGLPILISDNPGAEGDVVGGIDAHDDDNKLWRNQQENFNGVVAPSNEEFLQAMNDMLVKCTRGADQPDMIIMDKNYYLLYIKSLQDNKIFVNSLRGDGGFTTLLELFSGIPVYCDNNCPENHAYFINTNYLFFKVHENANFKFDTKRLTYNQSSMLCPMIFMGNLTCANRNLQGVICKNAPAGFNQTDVIKEKIRKAKESLKQSQGE